MSPRRGDQAVRAGHLALAIAGLGFAGCTASAPATTGSTAPASAAATPIRATTPPTAAAPSARPEVGDGEAWILFGNVSIDHGLQTSSAFLVRPDGTGVHQLVNTVLGSEVRATWSPDGASVAYVQAIPEGEPGLSGQAGVWVVDADGAEPRLVIPCDGRCVALDYVDWASDGRLYVGAALDALDGDSPPATFQIWRHDPATGETAAILTRSGDGMTVEQPRVSPDATQVVYFRQQFFDPAEPDVFFDGETAIFVADIAGGEERRLTPWDIYAATPDWSVDDRIVFNSYDIRLYSPMEFPGSRDLYVVRPDGTDLQRLTFNDGGRLRSGQPRWTPDGTGITYTEWIGTSFSRLAYIASDGTGQRLLTATEIRGGEPEMRPDP
jgi:Tol biopolymer transport system component